MQGGGSSQGGGGSYGGGGDSATGEGIKGLLGGVGSTTLEILGSGSGGGRHNAGGSKASWFSLANVGSTAGGEIKFFKTALFSCFCTSGLRTNGLSVFFWSLMLLSFTLNSSSTK